MYTYNQIAPEKWMESLYPVIQNRRLNEIVIPGTHDSGCYQFESVAIKTQDKSIFRQLQAGVRYFDLRFICIDNLGFHIHHGLAKSFVITLTDIVKPLKEFLDKSPKEIVILHITHFQNFNQNDYNNFLSEIWTYLGSFMAKRPKNSKRLPTIKEMVDVNQRIILSSDFSRNETNKDYKDYIWDNIDSPYNEEIYMSGDPNKIIDYLSEQVNNKGCKQLWVLQGVMTLNTTRTIGGVVSSFLPFFEKIVPEIVDVSIQTYANKINPILQNYLYSDAWRGKYNIFISDFISDGLIQAAIYVNGLPDKHTNTYDRGDRIFSGSFLSPGERLLSEEGDYELVYQEDGNLVFYNGNTPLFGSKTNGKAWRTYYERGTLAVYSSEEGYKKGSPDWKLAPQNSPQEPEKCVLIVQSDGNVVSYDGNKKPLWAKEQLMPLPQQVSS